MDWKKIEVYVSEDDYETLLRAQAAFRRVCDSPNETARVNASNMMRAAENIAVPALCAAVEQHSKDEAH